MENLYPILLSLQNKEVLVVGGGCVATRKVKTLMLHNANVTIVSPDLTEYLENINITNVKVMKRRFRPEDIKSKFIVFSATNDSKLNKEIKILCNKNNILLNAVDDPENCDFYIPSIIRRKSLVIAISTEGKYPFFAKLLRKKLEETINSTYGEIVDYLGEIRSNIKKCTPEYERKKILRNKIYEEIFNDLKTESKETIKARIDNC
ncbi:MAG: bifunctional precorrin-2 dehydrogenase/sirohydrochlorin ferrochelatase [Caldisericia bacterium]|nr:bifunctional precorrin-2 dehydrogenase/sirohydrochlorin ferrochelatase [Caldisericia bacterium]